MVYARKVDKNHGDIVECARKNGITVIDCSRFGEGFPDTVFVFKKICVLVEIKEGSNIPSKRKLTKDQRKFFDKFTSYITVVENIEQTVNLCKRMKEEETKLPDIDFNMGALANAK